MRYLLYARKSSESDDKQAQSIEDQLKDLRAIAAQRNLVVVGELAEAKSAKAPGGRPVFAEMISRIQAGEADAILCWHVNRLFRNPIDFGTVSWMLQTGALKEIHTPSQVHSSGDNVLLLSVENGMANQYILDLRKAVLRGLVSKVEKGWYPHKAPEGYLNADAKIEPDTERFPLIRKAWELMLTGRYTAPQVLEVMTRDWGYTTKRLKKTGGTPLTRASSYNLFSNIFYTGYFKRNGEIFQGRHVPMITMEEFLRVQGFLHRRHQVRGRSHNFTYAGLMECGDCGCAVTGDRKQKTLRSGEKKVYTYYCCSNAKRNCTRRVITEEDIDRQITNLLHTIQVPPQLRELGQDIIRDWKEREMATQNEEAASRSREIEQMEQKRDKLLDLKLRDLLDDSEYLVQKARLTEQLSNLRVQQQLALEQGQSVWDNLENTLSLAAYGTAFFESGEPALRALIAKTLGARYVLTNKRLAVEINPIFSPLCEMNSQTEAREPEKATETGSGSRNSGDLSNTRQFWWGILDAIRTHILTENRSVPSQVDLLRALPVHGLVDSTETSSRASDS